MWTKSATGMQRRINREKLGEKQAQYIQSIPACTPLRGEIEDPSDGTWRQQVLANEDSAASAWMVANPGFHANTMPNSSFTNAYATRCGLGVMGSRTHCVCAAETDKFGEHGTVCRLGEVRSAIRIDLHGDLKYGQWRSLRNNLGDIDYSVEDGEQHVSNYYEPKTAANGDLRSDICINNNATNEDTVIDITTTSAIGKGFKTWMAQNGKTYLPGVAGEYGEWKKGAHYDSKFHLDQRTEGSKKARLKTMCWETNGAVGPETKAMLREIATMTAEAHDARGDGPPRKSSVDLNQRQLTQKASVTIQNWRARSVRRQISKSTLDARPTIPRGIGDGPIPALDPPAHRGLPLNRRRFHAMTPLPAQSADTRPRHEPRQRIHNDDDYPQELRRTAMDDGAANALRQLQRTSARNGDND
jgi:hypothetical protein